MVRIRTTEAEREAAVARTDLAEAIMLYERITSLDCFWIWVW